MPATAIQEDRMPLYEYVCEECGQEFEQLVRLGNADSAIACPTCSSIKVRKKLSTFATKARGEAISFSTGAATSCSTGST